MWENRETIKKVAQVAYLCKPEYHRETCHKSTPIDFNFLFNIMQINEYNLNTTHSKFHIIKAIFNHLRDVLNLDLIWDQSCTVQLTVHNTKQAERISKSKCNSSYWLTQKLIISTDTKACAQLRPTMQWAEWELGGYPNMYQNQHLQHLKPHLALVSEHFPIHI